MPYPELGAEEADTVHRVLDNLRRFASTHVDSARIDHDAHIPEEVLAGLRDLGLFGLSIPTDYGGAGFSPMATTRILQELGGIDASLALVVGTHVSIGTRGILLFGSDTLKQTYLPRLANGSALGAFALTESGAGSDAAAIQTHAELNEAGDAFRLNGSKIWITNGSLADVFTVFARTSPPGEGVKPKLTAFLVDRAMGVRHGSNERKLGIRGAPTTPLFFDDLSIPASHVLDERGRGFKVAVEVLNDGRLSLAAGCVGLSRRLVRMTIERTQERRAFGRTIGEFGLIKDKVAHMMADTFASESMVYLTAGMAQSPEADWAIESAICKVAASETLWRTANDAVQIAAGAGYMQDYPYERMLRDSRINLIFDGTNEVLRCFIALSGMQGPGRSMAEVSKAMREPIKGFGLLSDFALRKARTALGRERLTKVAPVLHREAVVLEEWTGELARCTEKVLRKHGTDISEMQFTQKRIANMAIDLFGIAAVLARTSRAVERRGEEGARREIDLTTIFVNAAERRLAGAAAGFERNDDELRKMTASRAYLDRGYPVDIL